MAGVGLALVLLAFDRESLMMAAFGWLGAAGLVVSAGAWVLLARERRGQRDRRDDSGGSGAAPPG
jgi:hypothetical protein